MTQSFWEWLLAHLLDLTHVRVHNAEDHPTEALETAIWPPSPHDGF